MYIYIYTCIYVYIYIYTYRVTYGLRYHRVHMNHNQHFLHILMDMPHRTIPNCKRDPYVHCYVPLSKASYRPQYIVVPTMGTSYNAEPTLV